MGWRRRIAARRADNESLRVGALGQAAVDSMMVDAVSSDEARRRLTGERCGMEFPAAAKEQDLAYDLSFKQGINKTQDNVTLER